MKPIIALLTDFGTKDGFVGAVKGVIKSINLHADIIDISHDVDSFDILEASIILNAVYKYFPKGTIFVSVVDPGVGTKRKAIIVETENYYFVAPDNGLLTLPLKKEKIIKIVSIENPNYTLKRDTETFHGRDIFAPVSAYLSLGIPIVNFGKELKDYTKISFPEVKKEKNAFIGEIIKFDKFGNAITNIEELPKNIKKIYVRDIPVEKICKNFQEGVKGKLNLIKGSFGFYEVFTPENSAKDLFNLQKGDKVYIYTDNPLK